MYENHIYILDISNGNFKKFIYDHINSDFIELEIV
jgi:hypothetical protein